MRGKKRGLVGLFRGKGVGIWESCLVCYYGTAGCSRVGGDNDSAIEDTADDCGARAGGFGEGNTFGVEGGVAVVVGEVEAGHCGRGWG